jgi:hypothetical protein
MTKRRIENAMTKRRRTGKTMKKEEVQTIQ